jgi:hypothetical protein
VDDLSYQPYNFSKKVKIQVTTGGLTAEENKYSHINTDDHLKANAA